MQTRTLLASLAAVAVAGSASAVSPYDTPYGIQWNYLNGGVNDERSMSIAASPDGTAWGVTGHSSYTGANISLWGDQGNGGSWDSGYGQWSATGALLQGQSLPNITGYFDENQSYTRNHVEMRGTSVVLGWDGRSSAEWVGTGDPAALVGPGGDLMNVAISPDGTQSYKRTTAFLSTNIRNQAGVPSQSSDAYWFAGGYQGLVDPDATPDTGDEFLTNVVTANDGAVKAIGAPSSSYSAYVGRRNADGTLVGPAKQTMVGGRGHYLDMAVNEGSNIAIATGYVSPTAGNYIDMDGDGTPEYTASDTNTNGYIGIYDATTMALTGHIGWVSASATQQPTDVAATPDGGFIVVGLVTDARNGFTNPAPGTADTVIEKYNSAGVLQWAWQSEDVDNAVVGSVQVDADGNIYIGERIDVTRVRPDGTPGNSNHPLGSGTGRVVKFDSAGNLIWSVDTSEAGTWSNLEDIGVADKKWVYGISETNPVGGATYSNVNGYVATGDDRELLMQKLIPGDFNADGATDAADIALADAAVTGAAVDTYDFDEDGDSDRADISFWYYEIFGFALGDVDGDGDVDGVDVSSFFSGFSGPGGGVGLGQYALDVDYDGDVDGVDLSAVFGAFTGPLAPATVPEPTSLALLGLGGLLIARRRRA